MSQITFLQSNQSLDYCDAVIPTTLGANEARNEACGGRRIKARCSIGEGVERCVACVRDATACNRGRACGVADDDGTALCRCVSLGDFMSCSASGFTTYERLGALRSGGGNTCQADPPVRQMGVNWTHTHPEPA